jgi:hypothetical protein
MTSPEEEQFRHDTHSAADGNCEEPPSPPLLPQNTTIWPSQFKCQDLSCSIACSKLKPMADEQNLLQTITRTGKNNGIYVPGSGNSFDAADEMTTADKQQQQQEQSTADAAATLVNNYFNMNPRIFDLNELDLESGEWNWDLNDVGFLGLFKLGDSAPAATTTTATEPLPPPPAEATTTPATNQHASTGGKRVKQLEILHEHLHHHQEEEEEEPSRKKKKKKKQK